MSAYVSRLSVSLFIVTLLSSCGSEPDDDWACSAFLPGQLPSAKITKLVAEPPGAFIGDGDGLLDVDVFFWFEGVFSSTFNVKYRLLDSLGSVIAREEIEQTWEFGTTGPQQFSLSIPTAEPNTYRIRVGVDNGCSKDTRWSETEFKVVRI